MPTMNHGTLALRTLLASGLLALSAACGSATPAPENAGTGAGGGEGAAAGGGAAGGGGAVASKPGDRDNDGIADAEDECPDQPEILNGVEDEDGCPEFDQDGDGIFGAADQCPADPEDVDGDKDDDGCPDVDGDKDGVADAIDKCPNELETMNGYEDSDGCPDKVPDPVKKFSGTIHGIEFAAASANIRHRSYKVLNRAAKMLNKFPSVRIEIQGHTDDSGPRDRNVILSQQRADAVRAYLIEQGVDPNRMVAKGYGPDKPIASNKTRAGQAKNRRVEFKLIGEAAH